MSIKKLTKVFLNFAVTLTAANTVAFMANASEEVPYIECNGKEYMLMSKDPETEAVFLYFSNGKSVGVADELARKLSLGWSAVYASIKINPSVDCKLADEDHVIGITKIRCSIRENANIKLKTEGDNKDPTLTKVLGGSILFVNNTYYSGLAEIALDLITDTGKGLHITRALDSDRCSINGIGSP